MNTNNPFTEIGIILISVLLIVGSVLLLVLGKIDFTAATLMFALSVGLYGANTALKAPSPAQQAQLQQLTSQALNVLPSVVAAVSPPAQVQTSLPVGATAHVSITGASSAPPALWPVGAPPVSEAPLPPTQAPVQPVQAGTYTWTAPPASLASTITTPAYTSEGFIPVDPIQASEPQFVPQFVPPFPARRWGDSAVIPVVQPAAAEQ